MQLPPFGSFRNRFPAPPPLSGAGEDMSERPRRRASASPVRSLRRRFRSLPPSAPLEATRPATVHTASGCSLPSAAPHSLGGRFRNVLFSPPHVGGSNSCKLAYTALHLSTAHPRVFRYEKGGRFPVPLMGVFPTLPIRPQRFRASRNPTLSRPQSPGDRRSERSGCVRPRPVPQHLRVAWRGFR